MLQKTGFKIFVVLFSLAMGGLFIWQSSRELSEEVSDLGESEGDKEAPARPLMSGSKTRSATVMEVDEAWELAVPLLEEKANPEERE